MTVTYYKLPIQARGLMTNASSEMVSLEESIVNYLHLIMTTRFGECQSDASFGCALWDVDFNNMGSNHKLRAVIADSLTKSLKHYEKRLSQIEINVNIEQDEMDGRATVSRVKKMVLVHVIGVINKTNENFTYKAHFYIAPLSY
ncbi:GPW/gp25 family protein [Tamlana sp. s12]|uniref:GPW/gp25 family protein n=1 Tax=Tamlana sp. s12 TaxID=1630406 RepID=UPI0007FEA2AA|nr:GPW/gp25 family protein [Tamlana sp. s12]OBQ56619.1 hypothetical protein VQ01_04575 [Tamlana sp. s12]QQY81739.1 GPW/gp25 family protein [Tamlana sp. s12]